MGILKGALLVGAGVAAGIIAKKLVDDYEAENYHDFDDCDYCGCDCECEDGDCCCCCNEPIADSDDIAEAANDFDGNGESVDFSKNPDGELVEKKEI